MANIRFAIARRRSDQRLHGDAFLNRLVATTGLRRDRVALLDPARTVLLDDDYRGHLSSSDGVGACRRAGDLRWSTAIELFRSILAKCDVDAVDVVLFHERAFMFRTSAEDVVGALRALMAFDGGTMTVVRAGAESRLSVSSQSETEPSERFEIAAWGEFAEACEWALRTLPPGLR